MPPRAPPATGARARRADAPWREPTDPHAWVPTDLGDGRTLWRPPAPYRARAERHL